MRQLAIMIVALWGMVVPTEAQTFMEHIRKNQPGQGTVTVTQSPALDALVNGKAQTTATPTHKTEGETHTTTPTHSATKPAGKTHNETSHTITPHKEVAQTSKPLTNTDNEEEIPVVDMRKKVMRGGYKITGYRVQAFAGGNTRQDRQTAEKIRNAIKMKFPDQPVYVHFYSPRWICRVGNYRTYEEAAWMLGQLHKMGYKAATIVKGKITVQY